MLVLFVITTATGIMLGAEKKGCTKFKELF